jgi:hypothetical protein
MPLNLKHRVGILKLPDGGAARAAPPPVMENYRRLSLILSRHFQNRISIAMLVGIVLSSRNVLNEVPRTWNR